MKKICVALVLVFLSRSAFALQIVPKVGFDIPGAYGIGEYSGSTMFGVNLGAEILQEYNKSFTYGAGIQYLLGRDVTSILGYSVVDNVSFGYVPVYGTAILKFTASRRKELRNYRDNTSGYGKLNLGYNVMYYGNDVFTFGTDTLSGGLYWGAGAGMIIDKKFNVEIMYESFAGTRHRNSGETISDSYSKIGISFGYFLDIGGGSRQSNRSRRSRNDSSEDNYMSW